MVTSDPPVRERTSSALKRGYGKLLAALLIACLPFGVFIVAAGLHQRSMAQPVHGGITTTGVVVSYRSDGKAWLPTVAFRTSSGGRATFTAPETIDRPQLGAHVVVFYRPGDPVGAHDLSEPGNAWELSVILGLLLSAFGTWVCWRIAKARLMRQGAN